MRRTSKGIKIKTENKTDTISHTHTDREKEEEELKTEIAGMPRMNKHSPDDQTDHTICTE